MPVSIERLPLQPIVIVKVSEPFNPATEMEAVGRQFMEMAQAIGRPVYRIIDTTHWHMSFSDLVNVMDEDVRSGADSDPNIHSILVGTSEFVALGSQASKQEHYGGKHIPLFASMEEALAYIHTDLIPR